MSQPLTKKTADHSTDSSFSFSFYCDNCGKEWASQSQPFNNGGVSSIENTEIKNRIWADERRLAFEHANLEAQMHFNHCPKCGKWVCCDCFNADGGTCRECGNNEE